MSYTAPPFRFDHELVIGDTYAPGEVQLIDVDGSGFDLTDATGEVFIQTEPGGETLITPTLTVSSPAEGIFSWSAPDSDTADMQPGKVHLAVVLTFGDGTVRTVIVGTLSVVRTR